MKHWRLATKFDAIGAQLADRHYSRRAHGSSQFMPPGQTIVLILHSNDGVFGWQRPHPNRGILRANGFNGWTCTIFRNESAIRSSDLILDAEQAFSECGYDADELRTYVDPKKVAGTNPGYCFICAGWSRDGIAPSGKIILSKLVHVEAAARELLAAGIEAEA